MNKIITFNVGNKDDMHEFEEVKKDVAEEYAKSVMWYIVFFSII